MHDYSALSKPSELPAGNAAIAPLMAKGSKLAGVGMNMIHGGTKAPNSEAGDEVNVVNKGIGPNSSSFYSQKQSEWIPSAAAQGVVANALIAQAMAESPT